MTTTAIATPPVEDIPPLVRALRRHTPNIERALPEGYSPDRFVITVEQVCRSVPKLLDCTEISVISSVMTVAQLGLEPGPVLGEAWVIPRWNSRDRTNEATIQIGYKGWRELAYRSGLVKSIDARIVYEGDDFDYEYGLGGVNWRHKPLKGAAPDRPWVYVYAAAETVGGGEMFEAMSREEVLAHRDKYAQKNKDGSFGKAWRENEAEMGRKTVLSALCRQLPKSAILRAAAVADGASPRALVPDILDTLAIEAGDTAEPEATETGGE